MRTIRFFLFLSLLVQATPAFSLSVEEAYNAIPHRRTEYSVEKSTLPSATKNSLDKLFKLSDRALVLRVGTLKSFQKKDTTGFESYQRDVSAIIKELEAISDTESKQLATLLKEAIQYQQEFFIRWHKVIVSGQEVQITLGSDTSVRQASQRLHGLYSVLMQRYPNEHPQNIDSFYQHLCALDFI